MHTTQYEINHAYKVCESIKDELVWITHKYQAKLAYLESLCKTSGLKAQTDKA
jgi:hypothetical protein